MKRVLIAYEMNPEGVKFYDIVVNNETAELIKGANGLMGNCDEWNESMDFINENLDKWKDNMIDIADLPKKTFAFDFIVYTGFAL